jgi:hypothetical protein
MLGRLLKWKLPSSAESVSHWLFHFMSHLYDGHKSMEDSLVKLTTIFYYWPYIRTKKELSFNLILCRYLFESFLVSTNLKQKTPFTFLFNIKKRVNIGNNQGSRIQFMSFYLSCS